MLGFEELFGLLVDLIYKVVTSFYSPAAGTFVDMLKYNKESLNCILDNLE